MRHTPGPWKVVNRGTEMSPDRFLVDGDDNNITHLWEGNIGEEAQANARLIVAAPELLEALELVKRCNDKGFINLMTGWSRTVNNAIRKAKA